jgi:hypothetical protein
MKYVGGLQKMVQDDNTIGILILRSAELLAHPICLLASTLQI